MTKKYNELQLVSGPSIRLCNNVIYEIGTSRYKLHCKICPNCEYCPIRIKTKARTSTQFKKENRNLIIPSLYTGDYLCPFF